MPVYATVEKDENVSFAFANRAHNDLAEVLLETGILGAILLAAFLIWFARRGYAAWFASISDERDSKLLLQREATLITVLVLAHSPVDYALRTNALSADYGFFCATLAVAAPAPSYASHRQRPRLAMKEPLIKAKQVAYQELGGAAFDGQRAGRKVVEGTPQMIAKESPCNQCAIQVY